MTSSFLPLRSSSVCRHRQLAVYVCRRHFNESPSLRLSRSQFLSTMIFPFTIPYSVRLVVVEHPSNRLAVSLSKLEVVDTPGVVERNPMFPPCGGVGGEHETNEDLSVILPIQPRSPGPPQWPHWRQLAVTRWTMAVSAGLLLNIEIHAKLISIEGFTWYSVR